MNMMVNVSKIENMVGFPVGTKEFIRRAKEKHGNLYDYSLVEYVNNKTNVKIVCGVHGVFEQTPSVHLRPAGCQKCSKELSSSKKKLTTKDFIKKSKEKHGDMYDYSLVEYRDSLSKVKIICKKHGLFEMLPSNHCNTGQGCSKCRDDLHSKNISIPFKDILKRFRDIHGNKYDYVESSYLKIKDKMEIICEIHGSFNQRPAEHLRGHGCKKCNLSDNGFGKSNFERICNKKGGFGYLYLVRFFDESEEFYKIGITSYEKVKRRFYGKIPYNCDVINIVKSKPGIIYDLENSLHKLCKGSKYKPEKSFKGEFECFSEIPEDAKSLIDIFLNSSED